MLLQQAISKNKNFPDVKRSVGIVGVMINSDLQIFEIYYKIIYTRDQEDITHLFNNQTPRWAIDNNHNMMIRDENFNPKLNPDYKEIRDENGDIINYNEKYLTMPAFDYIKMLLLDKNLPMKTILSAYIDEEDQDERFNF